MESSGLKLKIQFIKIILTVRLYRRIKKLSISRELQDRVLSILQNNSY